MMDNTRYIEKLDAGGAPDSGLLGGKGASLCRLVSLGHRVPAGFVITRDAFQSALEDIGLSPALATLDASLARGDADLVSLARAMLANLVAYLPLILGVHLLGDWLLDEGSTRGMSNAVTWLWLAFTAFMAIRGVLMWARVRTDRWMVPGATR